MYARRILETCLYVDDLDAAERFYRDVLRLAFHSRLPGRQVFFRCGDGMLLLFNPVTASTVPATISGVTLPFHGARGVGHAAFAIDAAELPGWRAQLTQHGVAIESELTWPNGGQSLYFRDPAGNVLELATPRVWDQ